MAIGKAVDNMSAMREQLYRQAARHLQERAAVECAAHTAFFESPIEELLCEAMIVWAHVHGDVLSIRDLPPASRFALSLQFKVSSYRVDFLLDDRLRDVKAVIEADGHAFHERTSDQAAYDRARDREMQTLGYLVLRFTGSEIHHDPWACADNVFKAIERFANVRDGIPVEQAPAQQPKPRPSKVSPQMQALLEKLPVAGVSP